MAVQLAEGAGWLTWIDDDLVREFREQKAPALANPPTILFDGNQNQIALEHGVSNSISSGFTTTLRRFLLFPHRLSTDELRDLLAFIRSL